MGKVGTEATLKKIWSALYEGKMYIKTVAQQARWEPNSIIAMKNISDAGLAKKYFNVGDQIVVQYTNTAGIVFEMPWDIVHIGDATLADGTIKKDAIYLQSHFATYETIQFDKEEKEVATEATATDGLYYYGFDGTNYTLLNLSAGDTIPYDSYTNVYHNEIKDTTSLILINGYNRDAHSAYRQWLNSTAPKGSWWKAQHIGDCAPKQAGEVNGFLAGLPKDFVDCMAELTITQALNTKSEPDKTLGKETYTAKIFLPRLEQMYIAPQAEGVEGEPWDYYKELAQGAGLTGMFQIGQDYPILVSYALGNHSVMYAVRLASAYHSTSCNTFYLSNAGVVTSSGGGNSNLKCHPACVI